MDLENPLKCILKLKVKRQRGNYADPTLCQREHVCA